MSFYVGQRVVCVDDNWTNFDWCQHTPNKPTKGAVYTIRKLYYPPEGLACLLQEIVNPMRQWSLAFGEGGFMCRRFRHVVEKKTDISIFTEILDRENGVVRKRVDAAFQP